MSIITLTTDFGLTDEYVALMKGVVLTIAPFCRLVDINHNLPPQDVAEAARTIHHSYPYFPPGTIHLVVVDPGVGSDRGILALRADNHLLVGPDNGVFSLFFDHKQVQACHRVENQTLFRKRVSQTFHGRDIMAPVAAHLALGLDLAEIGPPYPLEKCQRLQLDKAVVKGNQVEGKIIHIDRFGNLRSSITTSELAAIPKEVTIEIRIGSRKISSISTSYSTVGRGELAAIVDSRNHLEIVINQGSAAQELACQIDSPVHLCYTESPLVRS